MGYGQRWTFWTFDIVLCFTTALHCWSIRFHTLYYVSFKWLEMIWWRLSWHDVNDVGYHVYACCFSQGNIKTLFKTQPSTLRGTVKWVSAYELSNNNKWRRCLRMVAANRRTHSPNWLVWSEALSLHSSNEPGELSQWLCHDDSTINIVIIIIIITIVPLIWLRHTLNLTSI